MNKIKFFTILILLSTTLFAQRTFDVTSDDKNDLTYLVRVSSNAKSFQVFIDNKAIKGNLAELTAGNHLIKVSAKGYKNWEKTVNITEDMTIHAKMVQNTFNLYIKTNVGKSKIYINNQEKGTGSFNGHLDPGTYTIVIRSGGFIDYKATVTLDRDVNLSAKLKQLMAKVTINIPKSIINTKSKSALNDIQVFVDGKPVKGFNFELKPGNHLIRIESGGFAVEGTYKLSGGKSYTIEPMISIGIE